MDADWIVQRNIALTAAFHAIPLKHRLRHTGLTVLAALPVRTGPTAPRERLLLIRPDHLGDVLLTTPAIRALRAARPDAEIHALVGSWSAEVAANIEAVDQVLTLPFPGFSRTPKLSWRSPYALAWRTAGQLRQLGYHAAFILRPDHWWGALIARAAGIPRIVGHAAPDVLPFLTDAIPLAGGHAVEQSLRLIERFLNAPPHGAEYRFTVHDADRSWVDGYLSEWGIAPDTPLIAVHPGSGTWVKRWDAAQWSFVADTLAQQLGAAIIFTGGDHELPLVQQITTGMQTRACLMVGETRVSTLAALYARAQLVLGPDSGPLHLAAAVGTPTVTLFGPADPAEFGPWGPPERHRFLTTPLGCRPCRILDWGADAPEYHPCVRAIPAAQVLDAARRALHAAANPG